MWETKDKYLFASICALGVLCCVLAFKAYSPKPEPKPAIYIISVQLYRDYEGRDQLCLQYAINGKVDGALFAKQEDVDRYIEYLGSIGNVRGEAKP